MPEYRYRYAERVTAQGLSAPDDTTMQLLWQIVDEGVLGAGNHVRLTQELLTHVLRNTPDPDEAWTRVEGLAQFIADTRGQQAPVVANVTRRLLDGLGHLAPRERLTTLERRIDDWQRQAERNRGRLITAAVAALANSTTLIAYDYSSTVAAIVEAVYQQRPKTRIVVPESRAIAGGRRYLEAFTRLGITVHYVLDAAFEQILETTTGAAVLLGAESVRCDGSLCNTVGSKPLARLAGFYRRPVFGCAELLKLDLRSYRGAFAQPVPRAFDHLLDGIELPAGAKVITEGCELEIVPAQLITGFFTEYGAVPPAALWALGREVFGIGHEDIQDDSHE